MYLETFDNELLNLDHIVVIDTNGGEDDDSYEYGVYAFYNCIKKRSTARLIIGESYVKSSGIFIDNAEVEDVICGFLRVIRELMDMKAAGVISRADVMEYFDKACPSMVRDPQNM